MDISFDKSPKALRIYVTLVGVFIAALVLTNLIAGRFFTIGSWTLSSGVIAYPVTFLVTDLISEIYGRKRADLAVKMGPWMRERGVLISAGPLTRVITHIDISRADLQKVVSLWQDFLQHHS